MRKALVTFLLILLALPALAAAPANPYTSVVSVTSTNSVVTFTNPAGATLNAFTVYVFNDGPNTIYVDPTAVAISTDTGAWALNKCEWLKINAPFNAPLTSINIVSAANQTATARVEANPQGPLPGVTLPYAEHGTQCYSLTNNAVISGATNVPLSSTTASPTVVQGVPVTGSDAVGSNVTQQPGPGTGLGAGVKYEIDRNLMGLTGTTAQTQAPALVACESKTLSNTTGTLTTLATVAAPSNSAGSFRVDISVTCNDGTNFDADQMSCVQSWKNKAGSIAFGSPQCTTSVAANDSGSCTVAPTFTAGSSLILINTTPVITTIVPTTTTGMLTVTNNSAGAVVCK